MQATAMSELGPGSKSEELESSKCLPLFNPITDIRRCCLPGALSFSPILKIGPIPHPGPLDQPASLERGIARPRLSASGQDAAHVARIPAATARCRHATVVESVGDLLQRGRSCLLHLLYDRQHRACEALGLSLTGLTTAAANGSELELPSIGRQRNPFRTLP